MVFVLGGPGAGKGTQCALLAKRYDFCHLSAGDLLREERHRPGSECGELINEYIREGKIVPMHITIGLLKAAMERNGRGRFLIDGFPRDVLQGIEFERLVLCKKKSIFFNIFCRSAPQRPCYFTLVTSKFYWSVCGNEAKQVIASMIMMILS